MLFHMFFSSVSDSLDLLITITFLFLPEQQLALAIANWYSNKI